MGVQSHAVGGHNASRLLPPVLQPVQPQISELLRLRVRVDRDHPALFTEFIHISHQTPRGAKNRHSSARQRNNA